jgi:hypothetical protein
MRIVPSSFFLCFLRSAGASRPCATAFAQHVFQRRGHALEHVAIQFALRAFELELHVLAGFARRLSDDAAQARHERIEGHHARAHEAFLQFRAHARLLEQQRFVLARQVFERTLQGRQVRGRLGQTAAELLQVGEAVEFERVERRVRRVLALVARDDLRFGFDVQAAQLVAQTRVGLLHFAHGAAEGAELLFQARAVNRDFARVVHQAVQQVGADAHLFLRGAHAASSSSPTGCESTGADSGLSSTFGVCTGRS